MPCFSILHIASGHTNANLEADLWMEEEREKGGGRGDGVGGGIEGGGSVERALLS